MAQKLTIKSSNSNDVTFSFESHWHSIINKSTTLSFILLCLLLVDFIGFDLMLSDWLHISPLFAIILFFVLSILPELIPALFYKQLLKEIIVNRSEIKFVYFSKKFNETILLPTNEINLICISDDDEVDVQYLEHHFPIPTSEFPLFLEKFSAAANLKFVETLKLDEKREVLKYKRN